jgi:3-oxoacyl-[acyl-carrier-protein] synthase-1
MAGQSGETISITGRGMVASLGHDVANACAAARAGLGRAQELENYKLYSPDDAGGQPAIGHPVPMLTTGFSGPARLLRLLQAGLKDLKNQVKDPPWKKDEVGFYLSLPDPFRQHTGLDLVPDDELRKSMQEESEQVKRIPPSLPKVRDFLTAAAQTVKWPKAPQLNFVSAAGHAGVAECLAKALQDLLAGQAQSAIVGGLDSFLDENTLLWLEQTLRLKTDDLPTGFQPGEACALLLLETGKSAKKREAPVFANILDCRLGKDKKTLLSNQPSLGQGLAGVLGSVSRQARWDSQKRPVWVLADQNGETHRAMEWGNALVRLAEKAPVFSQPVVWNPAASFGDTGAASGAISLCMATSAFERNYAPSDRAAILSSSDDFQRAAVLLAAPPK